MNEFYFSEKDNLFDKVKEYISYANRELVIISPYITTKVLQSLVFDCKAKITIITTWKLNDLKTGSSDLELYNYCKQNKIYLYLNHRIHLKVFINDYSTCLFGSANIDFAKKCSCASILSIGFLRSWAIIENKEIFSLFNVISSFFCC